MNTSSAESHPRDRLQQAIDVEMNSLEESLRALKSRHNTLSPISLLHPETLAAIFSFASHSQPNTKDGHLERIHVTHVCRQWRETALNHPRLWSHINLSELTPAGVAEILARAKMAPLHLEVDFIKSTWRGERFTAIERQLEAHISRTLHLSISGLVPPELKLFKRATLNLRSLELDSSTISWKSPLLKGLRTLKIVRPAGRRPKLEEWLVALNEMLQLETLILHSATTPTPLSTPLISEPSRAVTLPSLTTFDIRASAKDSALAFAHLVLPALTRLYVDTISHDETGEDVCQLILFVARSVYGLQSAGPLRSILINGTRRRAQAVISTMPTVEAFDRSFPSVPTCLMFTATGNDWYSGDVNTAIFGALLTFLPVNSVSTFTAQDDTQLGREFWVSHAPRLPLLERARLVHTAFDSFRDILAKDAPPNGPRFPSLRKLILIDVTLYAQGTYHLRDMLIKRVEQGVPLEVLDLGTCAAADREIQLLAEIVVDVQQPLTAMENQGVMILKRKRLRRMRDYDDDCNEDIM